MTILIKLSGEALSGGKGFGLDSEYIKDICLRIKEIHDMGVKIGIVVGGGNFMRGRDTAWMDRERADYVGMLATVMNSMVLRDVFLNLGCKAYNQSGVEMSIVDKIDPVKMKEKLDEGNIIVFGGGTGKPFFSTDTGAALRAKDIHADMIVKLTNVDGVYDKDPDKYSDAVKYNEITFDEVLDMKLEVMDLSSIEICRDNNIEICVMNINDRAGLINLINGKQVGTRVH